MAVPAGPWWIRKPRFGRQCVSAAGGLGDYDVASSIYYDEDARLIAAAPDLFRALDQLLDDMGDDGLSVCQAAKDQAKAALAKACGESDACATCGQKLTR